MELSKKKLFIFDLEGVLYSHGQQTTPLPGAVDLINYLKESGKQVAILTNVSTHTREQLTERLSALGFNLSLEEVYPASYLTALYLKSRYGACRCFVIGEDGLKEELEKAGHQVVDAHADTVVVGLDHGLSYEKLDAATKFLVSDRHIPGDYGPRKSARLVACHGDRVYPTARGPSITVRPIAIALETASGVKVEYVGKPSPWAFSLVLAQKKTDRKDAVMVGDSLEIDIAGANLAGIDSVFVLTGLNNERDIAKQDIRPRLVQQSIESILDRLEVETKAEGFFLSWKVLGKIRYPVIVFNKGSDRYMLNPRREELLFAPPKRGVGFGQVIETIKWRLDETGRSFSETFRGGYRADNLRKILEDGAVYRHEMRSLHRCPSIEDFLSRLKGRSAHLKSAGEIEDLAQILIKLEAMAGKGFWLHRIRRLGEQPTLGTGKIYVEDMSALLNLVINGGLDFNEVYGQYLHLKEDGYYISETGALPPFHMYLIKRGIIVWLKEFRGKAQLCLFCDHPLFQKLSVLYDKHIELRRT